MPGSKPASAPDPRSDALAHAAPGASTFSRGFVFDWYDGPVAGLVEREPGGPVFAFRMAAWDERQKQRIYVLQPVPAEAFDEAVRASRPAGGPVWPWWGPAIFPTDEDRERSFQTADRILRQAGPVEYVVETEDDLSGSVRLIHPVRNGADRERIESMLAGAESGEELEASDYPFDEWVAALRSMGS